MRIFQVGLTPAEVENLSMFWSTINCVEYLWDLLLCPLRCAWSKLPLVFWLARNNMLYPVSIYCTLIKLEAIVFLMMWPCIYFPASIERPDCYWRLQIHYPWAILNIIIGTEGLVKRQGTIWTMGMRNVELGNFIEHLLVISSERGVEII